MSTFPNKRLFLGIGVGILAITATVSLISYLLPLKKGNGVQEEEPKKKGTKKKDFDNEQILRECDLPVKALLDMSSEEKQRIFYALLMRGEMLLGQISRDSTKTSSVKNSSASLANLNRAIEYFSKAISIVPNPGEVIQALQQSIPPAVFTLLIERVQKDLKGKVEEYFKTLDTSSVTFVHQENASPNEYCPQAIKDVVKDEVIWKEVADISYSTISGSICDSCLSVIETEDTQSPLHGCPLCESKSFSWCSERCRISSSPMFHDYFCGQENSEALESLELLRGEGKIVPLLITRYVALLLSEEMAGNSVSRIGGPFNHYDHLVPVMKSPSAEDVEEATAIRALFANSVLARKTNNAGGDASGVLEFLTDQVYSIMKGTLLQNVFATSTSDGKGSEDCRIIFGDSEECCPSIHLFHSAAHLPHSCDPNCLAKVEGNKLTLRSKRNIPTGTPLTISFLPFPKGTSCIDRKVKLESIFGISCKCDLCLAEMIL